MTPYWRCRGSDAGRATARFRARAPVLLLLLARGTGAATLRGGIADGEDLELEVAGRTLPHDGVAGLGILERQSERRDPRQFADAGVGFVLADDLELALHAILI